MNAVATQPAGAGTNESGTVTAEDSASAVAPARQPHSAVQLAPADVVARVQQLLTGAYQRTVLARWLVPSSAARAGIIHAWITLETEDAFRRGLVEVTQDRRAAAVWLPGPTPLTRDWWQRLVHATAPYADHFVTLHRALADVPQPPQQHQRLLYAGVDHTVQARGLGRLLLRRQLKRLDARQLPAYAVAVDAASLRWLAVHGFGAHGPPILLPAHRARSAGDTREPPAQAGLTLQPMWREPERRQRQTRR